MDGVGAFAIIVAIICGGYLYFDYTKDRKKLIQKQDVQLEEDIQKKILFQLEKNGKNLNIIKYCLIIIVAILILILN